MTLDDQKKCSEILQMLSGEHIAPRDWTNSAGDELSKLLSETYKCSNAMSYIPSPSGSVPGWGWVVNYVYGVLKNRYNMNKSLIFSGCSITGLSRFRSTIPAECLN